MTAGTTPSPLELHSENAVENILDNQVIRLKRGRLHDFGFEPVWNAIYDFYTTTKYFKRPLLKLEDVGFHAFLRKNLNDTDPTWKMPSIPMMKRRFGISQDKIDGMMQRLIKAHLLKKISGKQKGEDNANITNEYIISDPIRDLEEFLFVANTGEFGQELRQEWKQRYQAMTSQSTFLEFLPDDGNHENGIEHPLPEIGKAPLPLTVKAPLPQTGKHKHTSFYKQTIAVETEQTPTEHTDIQETLPEPPDDVVALLIEKGFSKRITRKLAQQARQSGVDVTEKMAYLDFMLTHHPNTIKNPLGWLRRAIEEDFTSPEGYKSKAHLEAEKAEQQHLVQENTYRLQAYQELQSTSQQKKQQEREERLAYLQQQFGTTEREHEIWSTIKTVLKMELAKGTYQTFVDNTELLSITGGQAKIGVPHSVGTEWLDRQLSRKIKQQLNIELRLVSEIKEKIESVSFVTINE